MRRSGGMADASDSKSDVGDYVWVQVPSPALRTVDFTMKRGVNGFFVAKNPTQCVNKKAARNLDD